MDAVAAASTTEDRTPVDRSASRDADCPRCGYDLRGALREWTSSCPLDGRCAECGLSFRWFEILDQVHRPGPWYVERSVGGLRLPRRILATGLRTSVWPPALWRGVSMHHAVHPRLLLTSLLWVIAVAYVATALGTAVQGATWKRFAGHPPGDTALVAGQLLVAPFSPFPPPLGGTAMPGGWPLVPIEIWIRDVVMVGSILVFGLVQTAGSALTFLALPITRRRCRVRMAHVGRVSVLAAGAWSVVMVLSPFVLLLEILATRFNRLGTQLPELVSILPVPIFAGLVLWWWCAIRMYLSMPRALATALAVVLVGSLLAIVLGVYLLRPVGRAFGV